MQTINQMKALATFYGAEVRQGDYPYPAWNNNESFNSGKWPGQFFSNKVKDGYKATIYVPNDCHDFGFFHELGHVKDYHEKRVFIDTWANEVSAWCNAVEFMAYHKIKYEDYELLDYLKETLATYTHNPALWGEAINKIFKVQ